MAGRGLDQPAAWILAIFVAGMGFTGIYFGLTSVAKNRSHSEDEPETAGKEVSPPVHDMVGAHRDQNAEQAPIKQESRKASGEKWGYSGDIGESHWGELNLNYKNCSSGRQQSPIDLDGAVAGKMLKPIQFNYKLTDVSVRNIGHAIQVDFPPGNWIQMNGDRYDLLQFNFHIPSEHRVGGAQYEMEVQLVHKNSADELAVIGVFFRNGADNKAIAPVWAILPASKGKVEKPIKFDANLLLPKSRRYVTYAGSLTTPPCTEGITWIVMEDALTASSGQFDAPMKIHGYNARSSQALYGREVLRSAK